MLDTGKEIFALLRGEPQGKHRVLCLHNVYDRPARFEGEIPGAPPDGRWVDLLSGQHHLARDGKISVELAPYQVVWARLSGG